MAWKDPRPSYQWHQPHPGTGRETGACKASGEATLTPKWYCDGRAKQGCKTMLPQTPKNNDAAAPRLSHLTWAPFMGTLTWSHSGKGILGSTAPSLRREWSQWALSPWGGPGCWAMLLFPKQTLHPPGEISYVANQSDEYWTLSSL